MTFHSLTKAKFKVHGEEHSLKVKELAKNRAFRMLLVLFAAMTKFHNKVKKKIRKVREQIFNGEIQIKPTHQELEMMRNPRTIRR